MPSKFEQKANISESFGKRGAFFTKDPRNADTALLDQSSQGDHDSEFKRLMEPDSEDDADSELLLESSDDSPYGLQVQAEVSSEARTQIKSAKKPSYIVIDDPVVDRGAVTEIKHRPSARERERTQDAEPRESSLPKSVQEAIGHPQLGSARLEIMKALPTVSGDMQGKEREEAEAKQRAYIAEVAEALGFPPAMADRMRKLPYRYLPLKKLGEGGMGKVYEVVDLAFANRHLVMKIVHAEHRGKLMERFKQEARSAASIRNEHVGYIISADFMPDNTGGWYVMEKGNGPDLTDVIKDQPMPVAQAMDMMQQTADGLAAIHAKGIAHRDLKPANILVHQELDSERDPMPPVYKIIDFGLAKPIAQEESKLEWLKQQMLDSSTAEQFDQLLKKYGLSDSQRLSAVQLYKEMHGSGDHSGQLERMRTLSGKLPKGDSQIAYEVYLAGLESQKRDWLYAEVARLATLKQVSARDIQVSRPFTLDSGSRSAVLDLAKRYKKNPDSVGAEVFEQVLKIIEVDATLTNEGTTLGTPYYMPPEQAKGENIDTKSDIFSLGMTWYEALAGRHPLEDINSQKAVLKAMIETDPPMLDEVQPGIPQRLSDLVAWMMEKDPALRPSIKEVQAELATLKAELAMEQAQPAVDPNAITQELPAAAEQAPSLLAKVRDRIGKLFRR